MALHIVACLEALQYRCFTRATIPDEDNFEQEVEILLIGQGHQRLWIARRHYVCPVRGETLRLLRRLMLGLRLQLVIVLHGKC